MDLAQWIYDEAECLGKIEPPTRLSHLTGKDVRRALSGDTVSKETVQSPPLESIEPGKGVCIVVSDHTRKSATHLFLPILLEMLRERGCRTDEICVLVASGIHRRSTPEEISEIIGAGPFALLHERIHTHNADDRRNLVSVGRTTSGQVVRVNRLAAETGNLVLTGAATYHYHAGFGGGRKALRCRPRSRR